MFIQVPCLRKRVFSALSQYISYCAIFLLKHLSYFSNLGLLFLISVPPNYRSFDLADFKSEWKCSSCAYECFPPLGKSSLTGTGNENGSIICHLTVLKMLWALSLTDSDKMLVPAAWQASTFGSWYLISHVFVGLAIWPVPGQWIWSALNTMNYCMLMNCAVVWHTYNKFDM